MEGSFGYSLRVQVILHLLWGTFPTSAVTHDLHSYLFHKSMGTHGFSHPKFQLGFLSSRSCPS
jgi:hypothetical protein